VAVQTPLLRAEKAEACSRFPGLEKRPEKKEVMEGELGLLPLHCCQRNEYELWSKTSYTNLSNSSCDIFESEV